MRKATAAGYMKSDRGITYEQMKEFVDRGEYRLEIANEYHLGMEFNTFDKVLETFFGRKWVVLRSSATSGGFITCDHPLCLYWTDPKMREGLHPPGHGMTGTEIIFPLSPRVALVGAFELDERELDVPGRHVAVLNAGVVSHAEWQVFARDVSFVFYTGLHDQVGSLTMMHSGARGPPVKRETDEAEEAREAENDKSG